MNRMRYNKIRKMDISNGPGVRVSIFFQGCHFHCKGCFNSETWDFNGGKEFNEEIINHILDLCNNEVIGGLSILGGEPLDPKNIANVMHVINRIRNVFGNKIKIYLWTGYTIEYLKKEASYLIGGECFSYCVSKILRTIDVLIDGPYIDKLRDTSLKLRGSSNQRVLLKKHQKY